MKEKYIGHNLIHVVTKIASKLHFQEKIPRKEVTQIGNYVINTAKTVPGTKAEIVGSYRRNRPYSGDIDILFSNKNNFLDDLINNLKKSNLIEHVLSLGPVKFQGTYFSSFPKKDGILRKIDIRYVPPENWGSSLVHATGSDNLNIWLRQKALDKNLSLSEHGLLDLRTNRKIDVPTEEDVFNAVGVEYILPENRNI